MPLRLRKKITQPPTEIDSSAPIGGLHAIPFNSEGKTEITEEKVCHQGEDGNSDKKREGDSGEKKSANLIV